MGIPGEEDATGVAVVTKTNTPAPVMMSEASKSVSTQDGVPQAAEALRERNASLAAALPTLVVPGQVAPVAATAVAQQAEVNRFAHLEQIAVPRFANVTVPKRSLLDEMGQQEYGESYKEQRISANKRAKKAMDPTTVLYKKEQTAQTFEEAGRAEISRQSDLLEAAAAGLTVELREEDALALTKLMTGTLAHDRALLQNYAGTAQEKETALMQVLEDFLRLDCSAYDLSDEESIARGADSLEELNARLEGLQLMEEKNEGFFNGLPQRLKAQYRQQKSNAIQVVSYYRVTKMIVTDPYYRSHFNSEISRQYDPKATPAQRRLTGLLWRQTTIATHSNNGNTWRDQQNGCVLRDAPGMEKESGKIIRGFSSVSGGSEEYGKSGEIADHSSPHYAFFRSMGTTHPALHSKILNTGTIKIAGTDVVMSEGLSRVSTRMLECMKGMHSMTEQQILDMLENIYAEPAQDATPQEIEAVKQRNIAGFQAYKKLVSQHAHYLDQKYSHLYSNEDIGEVMKHRDEIRDDLCIAQLFTSFTDMIKKVPELYNPEDAEDRQLVRIAENINLMCMSQRASFGDVMYGAGAGSTVVGDRMGILAGETLFMVNDGKLGALSYLDKLEKDSPEVKWDAQVEAPRQAAVSRPVSISQSVTKLRDKKKQQDASEKSERAKAVLKEQQFSVAANPMTTSSLMMAVKTSYTRLDGRMKESIPSDEAAFERELAQIIRMYDALIDSTTTYEKKRNPRTTLGKQRKQMVTDIRESAERERLFFETRAREHFREGRGGSFGDVLRDMRTVILQPTAAMQNKGAGTSEVYKLTHDGKTVFFKPEPEIYERLNLAEVIRHNPPLNMDKEDKKMFDAIVKALEARIAKEREILAKVPAGQAPPTGYGEDQIHLLPEVRDSVYTLSIPGSPYIMNGKKLDASTASSIYGALSNIGLDVICDAYHSPLDKTEDEHKMRVCRIFERAIVPINQGWVMRYSAGADSNESAAMRNVATSRVAEAMDVSEMVAKSELACLEQDGKRVLGIAMDGAPGEEIGKIHEMASKAGGRVEYTAKAYQQISMMQVLDAICGQIDRKMDNFFGTYTEAGGVYTITGITAIDNDMAFGRLTMPDLKEVLTKDRLVALPGEFVQRIIDLDPAVLSHRLNDLLAPDKLTALETRLRQVQQMLRDKRQEDPSFTDVSDEAGVVARYQAEIRKANNPMGSKYFHAV